jgi:cell division control protein 6
MGLFTDDLDSTVFRNRDALKDAYVPEEVVGREDVIDQFRQALRHVLFGQSPDNIFVYGQTGSGKTLVSRYVFRELDHAIQTEREVLEQRAAPNQTVIQPDDLHTLEFNCENINTGYQLAVEIHNRLVASQTQNLAQQGNSEQVVYNHLYEALDDRDGIVILILDEIHRLRKVNTFLYEVSRAASKGDLTNTTVGIVGISTAADFTERLDASVRGTLTEWAINFDAYTATDLCDVLAQRVPLAFQEGVVDDSAVQLCGAYGARESGDARYALDLLRMAGDLAETENASVTNEYIKRARSKYETEQVLESLKGMNDDAHLSMYALIRLVVAGTEQPRTAEIYERYTQLAQQAAKSPVGQRAMRNYLSEFHAQNITDSETRSVASGGVFNVHSLNVEIENAIDVISPTLDTYSFVKDVSQMK